MTDKRIMGHPIISDTHIESPKRQEKFYSIQVMRAVAAFSVVLFHEKILPIGYSGVDIFFVISGFIMGTIGINERPMEFLGKRLIRVVPLYWLVTGIKCLLLLVPGVSNNFSFDMVGLIKSLLFIPYLDQEGRVWPILIVGWTLNFEMFFYLIFAFGLALARPRLVPPVVMIALVVVGATLHPKGPVLQTYTDSLLLEFIAGLALSQMALLRGFWLGLGLFLGGAALFALADVTGVPDIGPARVVCSGIPALALVSGALALERAGYWPRLKFLEVVGDASYSLYLLHGIIIGFALKYLPLPPLLNDALVICIAVGLAVLSYRLFELPMARLLRRPFRAPGMGIARRTET